MKRWKQLLVSTALVIGGLVALPAQSVSAIVVFDECANNADSAVCKAKDKDNFAKMIQILINTLLVVIGMISVIMIVVGGLRYTTSGGDAAGIKSAKDTILYAVIGLVVSILSFTIVNFVVGRF